MRKAESIAMIIAHKKKNTRCLLSLTLRMQFILPSQSSIGWWNYRVQLTTDRGQALFSHAGCGHVGRRVGMNPLIAKRGKRDWLLSPVDVKGLRGESGKVGVRPLEHIRSLAHLSADTCRCGSLDFCRVPSLSTNRAGSLKDRKD